MINNIAIASDHAGYKLKQYLIDNLGEEIIIKDLGTDSEESCDFTDFASEVSDFKFKGSRWTAALTNNIMNISNHALVSERQGQEVKYIEPQWSIIYQTKDGLNPFKDPLVGVREMLYFRPLTRHIFYQRFNY